MRNTTTAFLLMGKSDCVELSAGAGVFVAARSAAVGDLHLTFRHRASSI